VSAIARQGQGMSLLSPFSFSPISRRWLSCVATMPTSQYQSQVLERTLYSHPSSSSSCRLLYPPHHQQQHHHQQLFQVRSMSTKNEQAKQQQQQGEKAQKRQEEEEAEDDPAPTGPGAPSPETTELLCKIRECEDKYLRALAETENVRARMGKQISDTKLFAIQAFCRDLTEIEEILRLAIESVPKDKVTDQNKELKDLYAGLTMTSARLLHVFNSHGLTTINPMGIKFNPNEHEAVTMQEVKGKESGTVVFVSKLGYKLHDRVIKPAVVGVAK